MKTLQHAHWLSQGWKQAPTNQQPPARPAASRSRFRPDLETNKRVGGVGGKSAGLCLCSAAWSWSHSPAAIPGGIGSSIIRAPPQGLAPGWVPRLGAPGTRPARGCPLCAPTRLPRSARPRQPESRGFPAMGTVPDDISAPRARAASIASSPRLPRAPSAASRSPALGVPHPGSRIPVRGAVPLPLPSLLPLQVAVCLVPGRCLSGCESGDLSVPPRTMSCRSWPPAAALPPGETAAPALLCAAEAALRHRRGREREPGR